MQSPSDPVPFAGGFRPIYLHFLDRELSQSANFQMTGALLEGVLKRLVLGSAASLYCGISLIWENTALGEGSRILLSQLVQAGTLQPVSYNATVDEFIRSRQRLYQHDAARYPLYFTDDVDKLRLITPIVYKPDDTTDYLEGYLGAWSATGGRSGANSDDTLARRLMFSALGIRDVQALTYSYFSPFVRAREENQPAEWAIRRQISLGYAGHYLQFGDGDIATGIPGLAFYDALLSRDFPMGDVTLLGSWLNMVGLGQLLSAPWQTNEDEWDGLLQIRGEGSHGRLVRLFRVLIHAVTSDLAAGSGRVTQFVVRNQAQAMIGQLVFVTDAERDWNRGGSIADRIHAAEMTAEAMIARLGRSHRLAQAVEQGRVLYLNERTDVLIVTATLVESRAVFDAASVDWHATPALHHVGEKSYWDLGQVAGARVRLVQTEMGSGGPSGSILTVTDAIAALNPGAVVMVGIAFGIDPEHQKIGDVLVARQLLAYDLQRVGSNGARTSVVPRGDRVSPSPRLLDRCRAAAVTWRGCTVHFGLVVSGDKLVDNRAFRDGLKQLAGGEVEGGEMEGAGLYAAAHRRKIDWILVKAICDWADGAKGFRKTERQGVAARNAAQFLSHTLCQGGLTG